MVKVICDKCGIEFERNAAEVNRSLRLCRKQFCSRHCCGVNNAPNLPKGFNYGLKYLSAHNRVDEFTPFRVMFRSAQKHAESKRREFTITLQDINDLWEKQSGICPYTGWKLTTRNLGHKQTISPDRASLDRKDSSKGYTPDNIQIVSYMANCAKNVFTEKSLVDFCKAVSQRF